MVTKLAQIGNSQGLRLPKALIIKYHLDSGVLIEESADGLLIKPIGDDKLSWSDTYKEMKKENEDWSEWDFLSGDAIE